MLNRPMPFVSSNHVDFVATVVQHDPNVGCDNGSLYRHYVRWSEARGEAPSSHRALSRELVRNGYKQCPNRDHGRVWMGLRVIGVSK